MTRGIAFQETMTGTYHLARSPAQERSISFTVGARSGGSLLGFIKRPLTEIEGEVFAEGLARHRYLSGTLDLDVLRTRQLRYEFRFTGDDDLAYVFRGEKTLRAGALLESMTVLPGAILDAAGQAIGEALLRFDLRTDLRKFVRNFHVRW